ncbi:conserved unknown protein [Ectocarpus siliculosus]|uniref:JmjC domain-containing protein n=1 Tax=Ectocarpus siliculosus TaxID=2880 RepID=D7FPH7_ECTSI|nr:conserved unknown protein [Ectocarpus siliculosus]|eukprot:CBJ30435.1 conserved unknown protein [Ectocarpus siliculosus]
MICLKWNEGFAFAERRAADFETLRVDKIERPPFEITRFHVSNVTAEEFRDKYESIHEPLIIDGVPEAEGWGAANWTIPTLARKYPNMTVTVGTDDEDKPIRLSMKDFERYSDTNTDDTPMYVFDWRVYDDHVGKEAMSEYRVPSIFTEDLFQLVQGHKDYPSHRWLLVGPKRSGSNIHNDPLGTSAWNTLLSGRKLWFIAPPHLECAYGCRLF